MSIFLPPRNNVTVTVSPGRFLLSATLTSSGVVTFWPSIAVSTSPDVKPTHPGRGASRAGFDAASAVGRRVVVSPANLHEAEGPALRFRDFVDGNGFDTNEGWCAAIGDSHATMRLAVLIGIAKPMPAVVPLGV